MKNKAHYDHRVRDLPLEKGDRVLIQNVGLQGKHKLQDRWKSVPYVVVEKLSNLPVYKVKPEYGPGIVKTLHRDHLFPIGYMVKMSNPPDDAGPRRIPVTRSQRTRKSPRIKPTVAVEESDSVSSDAEFETIHTPKEFEVNDIMRRLASLNQNSGENEDSETFEEASVEAVEIQPVAETESKASFNDDTPPMMDSDAQETTYDSEDEQGVEGGASSSLSSRARCKKTATSVRGESEKSSAVRKSQRTKPTMRLTYDKPGCSFSEPVTIIHHGMVIQLKLNPPDQNSHDPRKNCRTSRRFSEDEGKSHPAEVRKNERCVEDNYPFRRGRV